MCSLFGPLFGPPFETLYGAGLGSQMELQMDEIWNPKCIPNVSQIGPQMEPKWTRNRTANGSQLDY